MQNICLIAAFGRNGQVGLNNELPWSIPEELKHFKETTNRATVIMGRKTFESIGKPLPNRRNIVVSSSLKYIPGVDVFPTFEAAIAAADKHPRVYVIGGPSLWEKALPKADFLIFSEVGYDGEADASIPSNFFETVRREFQIRMVRHQERFSATFWSRCKSD